MVKRNSRFWKIWLYFATALDFSVGSPLLEMFRFIFVCVLSYAAKKTVSNRTNCLVPGRRSHLESENSLLLGVLSTKEQSSKDRSLRCAPQERLLSQDVGLRKHPTMLGSFHVKHLFFSLGFLCPSTWSSRCWSFGENGQGGKCLGYLLLLFVRGMALVHFTGMLEYLSDSL